MRTLCAGVATLALGLATCLNASAQADNRNQGRNANDRNQSNQGQSNQSNQGEIRVIRGIIAGVTVEGETAIDYHTNRAMLVETSYLTIVGSEANQGQGRQRDRDEADRKGDQNDNDRNARTDRKGDQTDNDRNARDASDRQASSGRQRHNVYVVWLTPRTEIRRANDRRGDGDRNEQNNDQRNQNANAAASANSSPASLEALELGDRVEIRFQPRRLANDSQSQSQNSMNRKHGRHRTYFGDAASVTILAEPARNDRDRDSDRDRDQNTNRDRDQNANRDRNKQDNDRDK
jgi:hypothetical protein